MKARASEEGIRGRREHAHGMRAEMKVEAIGWEEMMTELGLKFNKEETGGSTIFDLFDDTESPGNHCILNSQMQISV